MTVLSQVPKWPAPLAAKNTRNATQYKAPEVIIQELEEKGQNRNGAQYNISAAITQPFKERGLLSGPFFLLSVFEWSCE